MEKLKDLIYDYSDILLGMVIVVGMFIVISFSLGAWFDDNNLVVIAASDSQAETTPPINNFPEIHDDEIEESAELDSEISGETEESAELDSEISGETEEVTAEAEVPVVESTEPVVVVEAPITPEVMKITIPNGTPGVRIAGILVDNGLIEDGQVFVQLAEELNLALKLKSGTFDIPVNSSIEEMIRIISGTN
ncbi:hypothetical protein Amet_3649 [Alkaliphilus metalliredigens QYMF]|uniref:Uncharacterized protein n=1 Tax=Alkaliphilus metalliredigens (strain QYMF) TaxID=293826 RepID=A6TUA3_ALKMQ|nr:hypothetical protein [Alkaliphilus metalliredigens]ABR49771.1 hypothetical protein Amet_3649 [Alkaliphilus metalliredigens QYMF]